MPGIINGSILKFQSQVRVPSAGSSFKTLRFTDTISDGLVYTQTSTTVVEYKYADAAAADPYTPITGSGIAYAHPTLTIDVANNVITNPTKDVLLRVTFYVQVDDVTKAINADGNVTNSAKFEMLDGAGLTQGKPATAEVAVPMDQFDLYVMGVPVTIHKTDAQEFNSVYFFGAMDGEAQENLKYKLYIYPNQYFDFNPGADTDYTGVKVTLNSIDGTAIDKRTVTIAGKGAGVPAGTIIIEIPHAAEVGSDVIHVTIPTVSNATVVNAEEPQFIFGEAELIKDTATIVSADKYNVQVNFIGPDKVLTDATKELILS